MNIKTTIKKIIQKALKEIRIEIPKKIELEHPDILEHGDYSCNIAMVLARQEKINPRELASKILEKISEHELIEKVEIAGPGFLNFYLSKKFYSDFLQNDTVRGLPLQNKKQTTQKILLEHSSPNLFKPFHIGHLVNNSIGESLGRILKFSGAEVEQISFPSDTSPGIAKTIWAIKEQKIDWQNITLQEIAEAYVYGTKHYQELEGVKKEVQKINIGLYEKKQDENWEIYEIGKKISLEHFKFITKKLGSEFSDLIFESEAEIIGKEIVQKNIPKIFKESQGAVIFEGSKYGLFDNVFINSDGFGTYLAKDIGLLKIKFDKYNFQQSITVTDVEQKQHFQLVKKSAELLKPEWSEKSSYLQHGRMSFTGKIKISSRYGNVPLVIDILDKLTEKIAEKKRENLKESEVEKIAIASLKYAILRASAGKNISFDLEKSLDFSGNSGPYLQYAYVRANSILQKIKTTSPACRSEKNGEVSDLEKILYRFTEQVEKSLDTYSPHHIANYLYEIAAEFNSFYAQTKILDEENSDYKYNLNLVQRFSETMKAGLELLGIETVEKM